MASALGNVYIGTSGWHYNHWKGLFYPKGLRDADQLSFYAESLNTVEVNNSFYRLPKEGTFQKWKEITPEGFLFSVKANRHITHSKKLRAVAEYTAEFIQRASHLDEKLGPILFQLPPYWKVDTGVLADFVNTLPSGYRYVFEFRNPSWYTDTVYGILNQHGCAFCIYELAGHLSPMEVTGNFVYVRLHGPGGRYQGSYPDTTLSDWAKRCQDWQKAGKDVFFYFDNDEHAYAPYNAKRLKELVS